MTRLSNFFAPLICIILVTSCKEDAPVEEVKTEVVEETIYSDTIFGELTPYQQYTQHFLIDIPAVYQKNLDSLNKWIVENQPGAIRFSNWDIDSIAQLKESLDTLDLIQPIYYANYFEYLDLREYPYWDAQEANRDLKWTQLFEVDRIGMVDFSEGITPSEDFQTWIRTWADSVGMNFVTNHFEDKNVQEQYHQFLQSLRLSQGVLELKMDHFDTTGLEPFRETYGFQGLFLVEVDKDKQNVQLAHGADFIQLEIDGKGLDVFPYEEWKESGGNTPAFEASTKRILSVKQGFQASTSFANPEERKKSVRERIIYESTALLSDDGAIIPLEKGMTVYGAEKYRVNSRIRKESKVKVVQRPIDEELIEGLKEKEGNKLVLLSDTLSDSLLIALANLKKKHQTMLCFSDPKQYELLKKAPHLIFYPEQGNVNLDLLVQQMTGQLAFHGDFVWNNEMVKGEETVKQKLAYTDPSFVGLSQDTLRKIDYAVRSAIGGRAFPGCQVLIAKEGCVFYDKSFGHHTYSRQKVVTEESLYDLASLTKVVATTLVGMKLYEMGAYEMEDSLYRFLPDSLKDHLDYPSTIRNITFHELFIHKSGLPAGFPVLPYMQYTSENVGRFDDLYCDRPDSVYSIEVAENFYLEKIYEDSMWLRLNRMWLDPNKPYKYSDVNMNTLYFIFMSIIENDPKKYCGYAVSMADRKERNLFVEFLYSKFYKPLGMARTKYKPLDSYAKGGIVPTENERFWRKQLLQGYVHDPNAALYGGIAGNAGVFSTTRDLAIYMEMLLQKGVYNGTRYLKAETVNKFVQAQSDSHRGLGFNKPSLNTAAFGCAPDATQQTYGHTGFTGTCFWVDPINKLTYVFLSNRVNPTVNNRIYQFGIRKRAHQYAYSAELFD